MTAASLSSMMPFAATAAGAPKVTGNYVLPVLAGVSGSTATPATNRIYYNYYNYPQAFSSLAIAITTAGSAGATILIGLFAVDPTTGMPGAQLETVTVTATATGTITANFSKTYQLSNGFWIGWLSTGSTLAAVRTFNISSSAAYIFGTNNLQYAYMLIYNGGTSMPSGPVTSFNSDRGSTQTTFAPAIIAA